MSRQSAALRTAVVDHRPSGTEQRTEHWYRAEDPYATVENDAAFAAFMAGDNPHLRTDEVPVVDFTSMIDKVGPDGRPVRPSNGGSRMTLALVAAATTAILAAIVAFGLVEIPGFDGLAPGSPQPVVGEPVVDGDQPLSITDGD